MSKVNSLTYKATFEDEVTGDIKKYDYDSKLVVSMTNRNHDIAEDLQDFLNDKLRNSTKLQPILAYGVMSESLKKADIVTPVEAEETKAIQAEITESEAIQTVDR